MADYRGKSGKITIVEEWHTLKAKAVEDFWSALPDLTAKETKRYVITAVQEGGVITRLNEPIVVEPGSDLARLIEQAQESDNVTT